jgi:glycerol-3-phosphate cytidylyltransferase-like family protein
MSSPDHSTIDAKNRSKKSPKNHFSHVMCFGTFDIFHPGHEYYLGSAEKMADCMTIVIARDHRVFSGK